MTTNNIYNQSMMQKATLILIIRSQNIYFYLELKCYSIKPIQFSSVQFSSVQFSHWVMSDSLQPHELQQARPPCPSPTPGVHSNSHPSSWWCHPAIASPSPPAPNPSQHQSLFQWINSSHEVAKVLLTSYKYQGEIKENLRWVFGLE